MGLRAALAALALTALGGGGDGTAVQTVELTAQHSRFSPAVVDVRPGTTVRFVVHNLDPIAHELIVGDDAVQQAHERGTEAHHGAQPGEVSVPAGATAVTEFTVGRDDILFGCHLPGHWDYGMRGQLRTTGL